MPNPNSLLSVMKNVITVFTIIGLAFISFAAYLSFNVIEPILRYYHRLDGPIHKHYLTISLAYITTIPLSIAIISHPNNIQKNYHYIKHTVRQYIIHTPIAVFLITSIYFTRMEHPFVTIALCIGLILTGFFTCGYQHIFNIADDIHQTYKQQINKLSQHAYIEHIRITKIRVEPNPRITFTQKIMLPAYFDTIKKIYYNQQSKQTTN